jgi:hypothetical protein
METKLLVMKPNMPHETRSFELPERPNYTDISELMQLLIGCQNFEHVKVLADFKGALAFKPADMFVDEMAHQKFLPRNEAATAIYRRNALINEGARDPELLPWIAGPAVLFERRIWS